MRDKTSVYLPRWLGKVHGDPQSQRWVGQVGDSQLVYQALLEGSDGVIVYSVYHSPDWGDRPYRTVLSVFHPTRANSVPHSEHSTWAEVDTEIRLSSCLFRLLVEWCTPTFTAVTGRPFLKEDATGRFTVLDAAWTLSNDRRRPPGVTELPCLIRSTSVRGSRFVPPPASTLLYQAVMSDETERTYLYSIYYWPEWGKLAYRLVITLVTEDGAVSHQPTYGARWEEMEIYLRLVRTRMHLESEWCTLEFRNCTGRSFAFQGEPPYRFMVLDVASESAQPRSATPHKLEPRPKPLRRITPPITELPCFFGTKQRRPGLWGAKSHIYEDKYLIYQGLLVRHDEPRQFFLLSVYYDVAGLTGPFFLVGSSFTTSRKPTFDPKGHWQIWSETYASMQEYLDRYTVTDEWYSGDLLAWWHPRDNLRVRRSSGVRYIVLSTQATRSDELTVIVE